MLKTIEASRIEKLLIQSRSSNAQIISSIAILKLCFEILIKLLMIIKKNVQDYTKQF